MQRVLVESSVPLTHAHGLVRCGLEAIVTEAAITSLCVYALSMAADVWNLLALITVCEEDKQMKTQFSLPSLPEWISPSQ